jgi:hypothetical protein
MKRSSKILAHRNTRAHQFRPTIEALEDRLVPTVIFQPQFGTEALRQGNGPVLSSTPVYLIFEGHYWQRPTGLSYDDVINRVNDILGSSFLSGLGQYGSDGHAFLAGYSFDSNMPTTDYNGVTWYFEPDLTNTAKAQMRRMAMPRTLRWPRTGPTVHSMAPTT